jgi:uncharacterized protein
MTTFKRTPRFIAGAVCPQCRAMDRIVLEQDEGIRRRRCVACGYSDEMTASGSVEPATRLARPGGPGAPSTPVRLVDPRKDDS